MRLLVVGPGASWSTADVEAGLLYGLEAHGVDVVRYRLDGRINRAASWLFACWRSAKRERPDLPRPSAADMIYQAGIGALEMALRHGVDAVLVISAMYLHPDVVTLMKRAGLRVTVLFTESPYDIEKELAIAALVDGCWTNERSSVATLRQVNPRCGYVPHAWHPARHRPGPHDSDSDVPAHDVVFVGTGFKERIEWFRAIDWTGIDLGLYGQWEGLGSRSPLRQYVRGRTIDNVAAAALYRRAKVGLNLYRRSVGFSGVSRIAHAESLNPRAYELAACGAFHVSDHRDEVAEVFGDAVPTFRTADDASALIRRWLADDEGRAKLATALPARVASASWIERAELIVGDIHALLQARAA